MPCKVLKLADISWSVIQPQFERALHRRVVGKKEIAVYELAEKVGVHPKTIEGYLYAGTEPKATAMHRLGLYFGPEFIDEVFGGVDAVEARAAVSLALADVEAVREAAAALAERLGAALGGQRATVHQLRERA